MKLLFPAGVCLVALCLATGSLFAQSTNPPQDVLTAPVPVADFFRTPSVVNPVLSPDGRFVAVAMGSPGGRLKLVVLDLEDLKSSKVIASFDDADVQHYRWVNGQRLVFSVRDLQSGDRPLGPGLWGVNRDGSEFRHLIENVQWFVGGGTEISNQSANITSRILGIDWRLHSTLSDGSSDVLVESQKLNGMGELVSTHLARLNTITGRTENLSAGAPEFVTRWVVDRQGKPAAVTTHSKGLFTSYLKTDQGWKKWQEADALSGNYALPYWIGFNNELLVLARNGSDTLALFDVDRKTLTLFGKALLNTPGYDFNGALVVDPQAKRLMGVHYETDARGSAWMDAGMREMQLAVDKLLPGAVNRIDCQRCSSVPTLLVTSGSDRMPLAYYLYHRDTHKLDRLGASRPWIKPEQMGLRDVYSFAARDGLSVPVLVTQPVGGAVSKRPAVVLVHGGPWVRGTHWEWERGAQFLASRGYVVIEPEFRGSEGYGYTHFRAGWKQWGLAMQDDVADAVQWATKKGLIDPERVCIAGASYGGYATLMGLIRNPDLYRCGINWVGVTDIDLMYSITWSDISEEQKNYGMPVLVGDRVKDAQQLKDTSPIEQASRINRPLLMAYGGVDRRVPLKHGTALKDAVLKTKGDVEWVIYPTEGHGWVELATNVDFWTKVENFLDKHIGSGSKK